MIKDKKFDEYKGLKIIVLEYTMHNDVWKCGYIVFPKEHSIFGSQKPHDIFDSKEDYDCITTMGIVNGGINYKHYGLHDIVNRDQFVMGWDYNHSWNREQGAKEITFEYVIEEAKTLIDYIFKKEKCIMTADKMFEKLGFTCEKETGMITYSKFILCEVDEKIEFNLLAKTISIKDLNYNDVKKLIK